MVTQADHKLRVMQSALLRSLCAHHVCVEKHCVANAGGAYTDPTSMEIAEWKAACTCHPVQVPPGGQFECTCGIDKTYSGDITAADYEQAISCDQIKNTVSQANNSAGLTVKLEQVISSSRALRCTRTSSTLFLLRLTSSPLSNTVQNSSEGGGSTFHRP